MDFNLTSNPQQFSRSGLRRLVLAVLLVFALSPVGAAFGQGSNFTVPTNGLETHKGGWVYSSGDTIILDGDDSSLLGQLLNYTGIGSDIALTIKSSAEGTRRVISPNVGYTTLPTDGGFMSILLPGYGEINALTLNDLEISGFSTQPAADNEGRGGALHLNAVTSYLNGNNLVFSNNTALGFTDSSGTGWGGAIWGGTVVLNGGKILFTGNSAQGGAAAAVSSSAQSSAHGGAIYASSVALIDGLFTFKNNRAQGGEAQGADSSAKDSGLGGAVHVGNSFVISGSALFEGNSAGTDSNGDVTSGLGGAVFINTAVGSGLTVQQLYFAPASGKSIVFSDNEHNPGNYGATANSIYFGKLKDGDFTFTPYIAPEAGAYVLMFDPIASQPTDPGVTGYTGDLALNLRKQGAGLWALGGDSELLSNTNLTLEDGVFHLMEGARLVLGNSDGSTTGTMNFAGGTYMTSLNTALDGLVAAYRRHSYGHG